MAFFHVGVRGVWVVLRRRHYEGREELAGSARSAVSVARLARRTARVYTSVDGPLCVVEVESSGC